MYIRLHRTTLFSIIAIGCIVGWSFLTLAPQFDPNLNSDQAVHVLMTYDLRLPDDLYYWGQNRLGSLLPIVSHFMRQLIPLSPVVMVGIVNYGLLIIAYGCFASFFSRSISWILLATAWFLPLRLYNEILSIGQPYAAQLACLGLTLVGLRWLLTYWSAKLVGRRVVLGLSLATMTASVWVSDFSVVFWAIVLGAIAFHLFYRIPRDERQQHYGWSWPDGAVMAAMGLLGIGFLVLAKSSASDSKSYTQFSSVTEILDLVTRMGQSVVRNLRLEGQNMGISLAAYCALAIGCCVIYLVWRYWRSLVTDPSSLWMGSMGLAAGCSLIVLLLSKWVYNPDAIPQRYFVVVYGLVWVSVLLLAERIPQRPKLLLWGILGLMAIANVISLPPRLPFSLDPPPRVVQLADLEPLAPAGFIGEYWHSYMLCSANPELFNCTPYDRRGKVDCPRGNGQPYKVNYKIGSSVRCERCVEKVLAAPIIYLVKQNWLEQFPQRIEQFGYCLEQSGQTIKVANRRIAPYRKL